MWTKQSLQKHLQPFHVTALQYSWQCLQHTPLSGNRKAAVLIPLVMRGGILHVWLTLRSSKLKNDGGDVSFPGGMKDPEDKDEIETCLREAQEEIGLQPDQAQIVAQLLPSINRRQILVTPIVALVDEDFKPEINPDEVEAAFCLPLERFLSSKEHTSHLYTNHGIQWNVHFFQDYVEADLFRTWGLTALMCVNLAITLFQKEPDFEWDDIEGNTAHNPYKIQEEYLRRYIQEKTTGKQSRL